MKKKIIETLKDLLSFKTYNGNEKEFEKIFDYIENKLKDKDLYLKRYTFKNKQALVVSNVPDTNLDIIFCTHIDVVPANDYGYKEDEENLYGRGTIDMKGSVAVLLELFNNLKFKNKVGLFITSDEEIDGNCVYELLKIYKTKLAIVPDGGSNFDFILEEKGLLQLNLSIKTKSAHSSQPFNGENAICKLIEVYEKLINKYPLPENKNDYSTSVNLSKLNGGNAINQVPDYAEIFLDIRHTSNDSKEEIIDFIKNIDERIKIDFLLKGEVFQTDMENENIKRYLSICEKVLNRKVDIKGCESTSDAIYFAKLNIPTIIMNPVGDYAHCPNEFVNKNSLWQLYQIYEEFLETGDDINE